MNNNKLKNYALGFFIISLNSNAFALSANDTALGSFSGVYSSARCADLSVANSSYYAPIALDCSNNGGFLNGIGLAFDPTSGRYFNTAALQLDTTSIGSFALANNSLSTAVGSNSLANGYSSLAVGVFSSAMAEYSIALGTGANVSNFATGALALGRLSKATAALGVALGGGSFSQFGNESYTNAAQMNGVLSNSAAEVSLGNGAAAFYRRLSNVADGYLNNDATNVEQLNSGVTNAITASNAYTDTKAAAGKANTDTLGTTTAAAVGGGAAYNPATGAISAPTITAAGATYNNTTSAVQALDKSAIQYDKTAGGAVDTSNATLLGAGGTTLHNVKDGVALTDAANVGQVQTAQTAAITASNAYTDTKAAAGKANTDTLGTSTAAGLGGGSAYDAVTGKVTAPIITAAGGTHSDTTSAIQALDKSAIQYDKTAGGAVDTSNASLLGVGGTTLPKSTVKPRLFRAGM